MPLLFIKKAMIVQVRAPAFGRRLPADTRRSHFFIIENRRPVVKE
jgi:hypothetical protein